jgi:hypothetical protein
VVPQKTCVVDYMDALRLASDVLKCPSTPAIERAIFHVFFGAARTHTTAGQVRSDVGGQVIPIAVRTTPVFVDGQVPNDVPLAVPTAVGGGPGLMPQAAAAKDAVSSLPSCGCL